MYNKDLKRGAANYFEANALTRKNVHEDDIEIYGFATTKTINFHINMVLTAYMEMYISMLLGFDIKMALAVPDLFIEVAKRLQFAIDMDMDAVMDIAVYKKLIFDIDMTISSEMSMATLVAISMPRMHMGLSQYNVTEHGIEENLRTSLFRYRKLYEGEFLRLSDAEYMTLEQAFEIEIM